MPKKKRTEDWNDASDKNLGDEADSTSEEKEEGDLYGGDLDEETDETEEKNY